MTKTARILAPFGVVLLLSAPAWAQSQDGRPHHHHHHRRHAGDGYAQDGRNSAYTQNRYGGGTLINNSNCPAGTQPHVWPDSSGYRCF